MERRTTQIDFRGPAGRLEGVLTVPDGSTLVAAAVICHAHPLHGGMMRFRVIQRAAKSLEERGIATLRFNFRGVGRSEGVHDGGRGEQDDARAAMDEIERLCAGAPLLLGGFSFGSHVALRAAISEARVRAVIVLGFPSLRIPDSSFVDECRVPRLFVQGEHDEFGDAQATRTLYGGLTGPKSLVIVPGGDHFFTGQLDRLQEAISSWAADRPWEPAS